MSTNLEPAVAAPRRRLRMLVGVLAVLLLAAVALGAWFFWPDRGDERLAKYVHARPPVPVVFTSRSEPASFAPAAPEGEGFTYPGQGLWQAREGRLRLLTPSGAVHELTWGRPLPDGGTLIDVMSPSVTTDGKRILFSGRRSDDHGRFRIYEIGVNGKDLRPVTGGGDDAGCVAVPPMRYRADDNQSRIPDDERRRVDYDDVDPTELPDGRIVFATSRTPDLGRGHSRRSTDLWVMNADGSERKPVTSNRNNDRWPFFTSSTYLCFSMWSRNTEVITADEKDIQPYQAGTPSATLPTDNWLGALVLPNATRLGHLVKPDFPVWHPRPLFNGKIVFMTSFTYPEHSISEKGEVPLERLRVVQMEPSTMHNVASARPPDQPIPLQKDYEFTRGPETDRAGRPITLGLPSPCPGRLMVLAGAPRETEQSRVVPASFGIYLCADDWTQSPVSADAVKLDLLFDDPDLVDAEPVAVYPRPVVLGDKPEPPVYNLLDIEIPLASGRTYRGPAGGVSSASVYTPTNQEIPGQTTDCGAAPIFDAPPAGLIQEMRFFASRRDRFDEPDRPRVPGSWELLMKMPITHGNFDLVLPSDSPSVLAGFDKEGRVARWQTRAADSKGRQATFFAFAGDHYSGSPPGVYNFCVGCHPGHSGPGKLKFAELAP